MADKVKRYEGSLRLVGQMREDGSRAITTIAGLEWVRAADYDTLKERADALAEHIEHDPDVSLTLMAALAAYREAGPNQLDDRAE